MKLLLCLFLVSNLVHAKNVNSLNCANSYISSCIKSKFDQPLTNKDKADIINGLKIITAESKTKYNKYNGMVLLNNNVIYDSEEGSSHVYILQLYFGLYNTAYKKCELTLNYYKNEKINYRTNESDAMMCENINMSLQK